MHSRRKFITTSALGIAGSITAPLVTKAGFKTAYFNPDEKGLLFPLGMAGYTFAKFDIPATISMMKRVGVTNLSVKDFHLPLDSSEEKIKSTLAQFSDAGIKVYTVGVIYMKSKEAVDQAFNYAKKVGVDMIVGVPNYDLVDYTEQQVKAFNIRIAIHNHGPEDKLYPSPKDVYEQIKNRDERMGLCLDIGHTQRTGLAPAEAVKLYGKRIFDLHIKDVSAAEKDGKAMEVGRGVIDFKSFIKELHRINYKGLCSFEFEKDMTDPLPGIAESVGYFRGMLKAEG